MIRQTRPVLFAATTVLGALTLSTLAACSASTNGRLGSSAALPSTSSSGTASPVAGSPVAKHTQGSLNDGGRTSGSTGVDDDSVSGSTSSHAASGSGGSNHADSHQPSGTPAPSFAYTTVTCEVTDHEDITGLGSVPIYSPVLTWKVTHATGMALSVDNPGLVGAYGTYGPSGSLTLGGGCYQGESALIEFYTVGGHGKAAHKSYHQTGAMVRPTAPPFANDSGSATPSASPSS